MNKIIKTTQGIADFRLREEFEDQNKAGEGKDPLDSEVIIDELKIENIKILEEEIQDADSVEGLTEQLAIIKKMQTVYGSYLDIIIDALKDLFTYSVLIFFMKDFQFRSLTDLGLPSITFSVNAFLITLT